MWPFIIWDHNSSSYPSYCFLDDNVSICVDYLGKSLLHADSVKGGVKSWLHKQNEVENEGNYVDNSKSGKKKHLLGGGT